MTHTVNNMTFEGIYDSILQAAAETPSINLPIPFDKFGWFYPVRYVHLYNKTIQIRYTK